MPVIIFFITGVFLLVLQTSLLTSLPDWMGRPDPLFVLIVFIAVRLKIPQAPILLLILGLVMDIFSGLFLGIYPIVYSALFLLLFSLSRRLVLYEVVHQIPLVLTCYLLVNGLLFSFATFLAPENALEWKWKTVLMQMFMLSLMTLPLFRLFDLLDRLPSQTKTTSFLQRTKQKNTFRG